MECTTQVPSYREVVSEIIIMGCPQSIINFFLCLFLVFFLVIISLSLLSCRIYYFLNFGITQSLSLGAVIECVMMHSSIQ